MINNLFALHLKQEASNYFVHKDDTTFENQTQVNDSYDFQWKTFNNDINRNNAWNHQKMWYLQLYGFGTEERLKDFLKGKQYILDAGCGTGYKAAWFAELAPHATVIGMDFSDGAAISANNFKHIPNLYFVKGDIADTGFKANVIDFVSCDQVLQHTESPLDTLKEFNRILCDDGDLVVYVYRKKALPRELVDDYFRSATKEISIEDKMSFSKQLTDLGKQLSELNIELDFPDIPLLNIKGGKQDLQRFIYWNFLKCFWNPSLGYDVSVLTNFDWYSPSNAARYSENEFREMLAKSGFSPTFFREEEAAYTAIASPI